MKQPIQPLYTDDQGVIRFHPNKIVQFMLDAGRMGQKFDLNTIACLPNISREDHEQLAQLIGYSLSGAGDLSYFSDETWEAADNMVRMGLTEEQARIIDLENKLEVVRKALKELVPTLFRIHPDDLES